MLASRFPDCFHLEGEDVLKILGMGFLLVGACAVASATAVYAPEIDAGSAGSALAVLTGALLVVRGRRKK